MSQTELFTLARRRKIDKLLLSTASERNGNVYNFLTAFSYRRLTDVKPFPCDPINEGAWLNSMVANYVYSIALDHLVEEKDVVNESALSDGLIQAAIDGSDEERVEDWVLTHNLPISTDHLIGVSRENAKRMLTCGYSKPIFKWEDYAKYGSLMFKAMNKLRSYQLGNHKTQHLNATEFLRSREDFLQFLQDPKGGVRSIEGNTTTLKTLPKVLIELVGQFLNSGDISQIRSTHRVFKDIVYTSVVFDSKTKRVDVMNYLNNAKKDKVTEMTVGRQRFKTVLPHLREFVNLRHFSGEGKEFDCPETVRSFDSMKKLTSLVIPYYNPEGPAITFPDIGGQLTSLCIGSVRFTKEEDFTTFFSQFTSLRELECSFSIYSDKWASSIVNLIPTLECLKTCNKPEKIFTPGFSIKKFVFSGYLSERVEVSVPFECEQLSTSDDFYPTVPSPRVKSLTHGLMEFQHRAPAVLSKLYKQYPNLETYCLRADASSIYENTIVLPDSTTRIFIEQRGFRSLKKIVGVNLQHVAIDGNVYHSVVTNLPLSVKHLTLERYPSKTLKFTGSLETLLFKDSSVTTRGLASVDFTQLTKLSFYGCKSLSEDLLRLQFPKLQHLTLVDCNITIAAINQFRSQHPHIALIYSS